MPTTGLRSRVCVRICLIFIITGSTWRAEEELLELAIPLLEALEPAVTTDSFLAMHSLAIKIKDSSVSDGLVWISSLECGTILPSLELPCSCLWFLEVLLHRYLECLVSLCTDVVDIVSL